MYRCNRGTYCDFGPAMIERRDGRNKFCFTGGLIESGSWVGLSGVTSNISLASVTLPGSNNVQCVRSALFVMAC